MADSKTVIANMALSHIGQGKQISDFDTETSEEAKACRQFYETAKKLCLRDFPWTFARVLFDLSLVETLTTLDENAEWTYSYQYPTDCLMIRRIGSGARTDSRQSRQPYLLQNSGNTKLIYCDVENARLIYTKNVTDVTVFPADFDLALSYKLAELISSRISAGDPFGMKKQMRDYYESEVRGAQANDQNEIQDDELPASEFERSREG